MDRKSETFIGRIWGRLLNAIYPPQCPVCHRQVASIGALCADCWKEIHFLDGAQCSRCGTPFEVDPGGEIECAACLSQPPAYDMARAVMRYDEHSKPPILALKHADRLDLPPGMIDWMVRAGRDMLAQTEIVVPVPLHWQRLWKRRYNQSAELARLLAHKTGLAYAPQVLQRLRPTKSQGEMPSAKARHRNVRGAFVVPKNRKASISGKTILLIDDVVTTGATVDACSRSLKRAGAKKVFVLALARAVRHPTETV